MAMNQATRRFARAGATTAYATARAKPTILVAEDNADSREMMQLLLEGKGYRVVCADDGPRAFETAIQNLPDLVLVDLEMPKVDGLTITRKLRAHPAFEEVPIIIVSGHDPSRYRQAALDAGCDDYLLKPIDFDRLDEILNEMIPQKLATAQAG